MFYRFRFQIKLVVLFFVVVSFQCYFLSSASAQIALVTGWEVDESQAGRKTTIFNAFKSGNVDADRAGLDTFFDKYYFARWTRPENTGSVHSSFVKEFLTQDLRDATGNAREYLLTKSFDTLKKMAADNNATPTSRYNAILTIGQLTQREPEGRGKPPTPYAQALPYLIGEYQKKENPKYIQLGSLIGIVRLAEIGIADETLKNTTVPKLFIEIIQSGKPKDNKNKEDQEMTDWFRLYALDGLGALKSVGNNGQIVTVLSDVIENNQETIDVRTHAARIFNDLFFADSEKTLTDQQYQEIGTSLITLMKATVDSQLQMITQLRDKARVSKGEIAPDINAMSTISATALEPEFAALTKEQQIEITGAVQNIKANILNVTYGMRGTRLTGKSDAGILSKLAAEDPVAIKINSTVKLVTKLIKDLDEGPPEDLRKRSIMGDSSMSEMSSNPTGSGGSGRRGDEKQQPQLKVNFSVIRDSLQKMSDELSAIIAGSGV
jgi:hypothetical protein